MEWSLLNFFITIIIPQHSMPFALSHYICYYFKYLICLSFYVKFVHFTAILYRLYTTKIFIQLNRAIQKYTGQCNTYPQWSRLTIKVIYTPQKKKVPSCMKGHNFQSGFCMVTKLTHTFKEFSHLHIDTLIFLHTDHKLTTFDIDLWKWCRLKSCKWKISHVDNLSVILPCPPQLNNPCWIDRAWWTKQ